MRNDDRTAAVDGAHDAWNAVRLLPVMAALVVAVCGCQPEPAKPKTSSSAASAPQSPRPLPDKASLPLDLCADRLQDIEGAMVAYYQVHHRLPEELSELKSVPIFGAELNFTCPISKKAFVYVPAGLECAGRSKRIYVYDADASHEGTMADGQRAMFRWCILMPPVKPGQQPFMEVLPIEDKEFRKYLPISQINP
jgi:hypothetical protein